MSEILAVPAEDSVANLDTQFAPTIEETNVSSDVAPKPDLGNEQDSSQAKKRSKRKVVAAPTEPLTEIRKVGIIGIGGPGISRIVLLAHGIDPAKDDVYLLATHTDVKDSRAKFPLGATADKKPTWLTKWESAQPHEGCTIPRLSVYEVGLTGDGSRGNPSVGRDAILMKEPEIRTFIKGMDLVIITFALGGGSGSGGGPEVAKWVKQEKKPGIAIVTMPFKSEGAPRGLIAKQALDKLFRSIRVFVNYSEGRDPSIKKDRMQEMSTDSIALVDDNATPNYSFAHMNEYCMTRVMLILKQLNQRNGASMIADFSDNTKLCREPGAWFGSRYDFPRGKPIKPSKGTEDQGEEDTEKITKIAQELMWGNPYHDFDFETMTHCVFVLQGPVWSKLNIDLLTRTIMTVVGKEQAEKVDVKLAYTPCGFPSATFIAVGGGPAFARLRAQTHQQNQQEKRGSVDEKGPNGSSPFSEPMTEVHLPITPLGNSKPVPVPESLQMVWKEVIYARGHGTKTPYNVVELAEKFNPWIAKRWPGQMFYGTQVKNDHSTLSSERRPNGIAASHAVV